MEIRIFDTPDEAGLAVASHLAELIGQTPNLAVGLPAGRTPLIAYAELRRLHASHDVDFGSVTAFLVDEYVGVESSHPGSFRQFVTDHLLSGINVSPARIHSLNGVASDVDAECRRYEEAIAAAGDLGLLLLGLGVNGHIGFNEPGESLAPRTHRVRLLEATRRDNAGMFGGDVRLVPTEALSIGVGTILRASSIVLMATGAQKAPAVHGMIRGPLTTRLPASFLQLHTRVEVYLDRAAASAL